jgi:transcriptional regulator of aromatic amino acid metabolism
MNLLGSIHSLLQSKIVLLCFELISFFTTIFICIFFIYKYYHKKNKQPSSNKSFYFFMMIIIGFSIENISWIIFLLNDLFFYKINHGIIKTIAYVAWIFNIIRYQSLALFLESLTQKKLTIRLHQKIFFLCGSIISIIFIYSLILQLCNGFQTSGILKIIYPIIPIYAFITIIPTSIITFQQIFNKEIPRLIRKQLKIISTMILFPHVFFDLVQTFPLFFYLTILQHNIGATILSTTLINIAFIAFAQHILKFRFLNTTHHISSKTVKINNETFKDIIDQISKTSYIEELVYITQNYFKEYYHLSTENVFMYVRDSKSSTVHKNKKSHNLQITIEQFIAHKIEAIEILQEYKIIVLDEIEFNAFYTSDLAINEFTEFLKSIKCSLFVPLFYKNQLIAYIVVKEDEAHHFFNLNEQNDIYILSTYLAHMIHIINTTNPQTLLQESQQLKQELFLKHQEVKQYKESMKHLLQKNVQHAAGIIFYKNNTFFFGNKAAQDLITINVNQQKNHPIAHALREIAHQVIAFKSTQQRFLKIQNNDKLLITGIPHVETKDSVILTIQYPEASDIIKQNLHKLQNPSQWDYALYLETTASGKLINALIPSDQEQFFNFKIKLLEAALTHKGVLLQCHPDDLNSIAELIHKVSLKETLHIIDLQGAEEKDLYIKLFGINSLFQNTSEQPLLQKLDKIGTLFIKNIEQLDALTQKELAHFIKYGYFSPFKSHEKQFCSVRIICSTNQSPQNLIERGILIQSLYDQLQNTTLKMPSFVTLKEEEIQELADGVTSQTVKESHFGNIIQLSNDDYKSIIDRKPASLKELTLKVHNLIAKKTNRHTMFTEIASDAEFETSDPDLLHAAQLGKYALKDEKLMALLWNTFKSQSKIAQFLGVNRSSINRRCKEYSLH